ncbi:MAG: helix-turn-helix domain-containing protein [Alphaproteobacteria bacterium]
MAALIDLLVATPSLSSARAADALHITPLGARRMLDGLASKSLVHELTGRTAFRLYTPASLARFLPGFERDSRAMLGIGIGINHSSYY